MLDNELTEAKEGMSLLSRDFRELVNGNFHESLLTVEVHPPLVVLERLAGTTTIGIQQDFIDSAVEEQAQSEFWIKITGSSGTAHTWVEVDHTGSGTMTALTRGRSGALNAYDVNGREGIPSGTYVRVFERTDENGVDLYGFDINHGLDTSLESIGSRVENETAQADEWDVESQGATTGVTDTRMVRMAYVPGGLATLWAFYRDYTYDSNGQLLKISEETRVAIETPVNCS